jgi:hypothetical protein
VLLGLARGAAQVAPQRLILSSGFLCFSNHVGVLRALEAAGELRPGRLAAVVGTSSGAICGSLLAAGLTVDEIEAIVTRHRPLALCRPSLRPWRGLFTSDALGSVLADALPPTFEDLRTPFAACVVRASTYEPALVTQGPLVEAVLASCAVPGMFQPVQLGADAYVDGGVVDRTAAERSREWLARVAPGCAETLVHLVSDVEGQTGFGPRDGILDQCGMAIVRTSRTRQNLARRFGRAFAEEADAAAARCAAVLAARGSGGDA